MSSNMLGVGILWRCVCLFQVVVVVTYFLGVAESFNIDTTVPNIISGPANSYFGFTVDFVQKDSQKWILVGAPRATDAGTGEVAGALYKCGNSGTCQQLDIITKAGTAVPVSGIQDMWLGMSLDVGDRIATCAPRWKKLVSDDVLYMNGICYEIPRAYINGDPFLKPSVLQLLSASNFDDMQINSSPDLDNFNRSWVYGLSTAGLSLKYDSKVKEDLLVGAPGVNEFAGSLIRMKSIDTLVYPQENTEQYLSEMYGYAIVTGQFYDNGAIYRAVGGPRDGVTGKVLLLGENYAEVDRLQGTEVGSYFGASLCATKINGDSMQERLLVGAPFYSNLTQSENFYGNNIEQGLVYVYSYSSVMGRMTVLQELRGSGAKSARFGSAMAAIGDINKDGYYDVAIGAPFEYDGQGAIYIYNGYVNGFWKTQSITARSIDTRLKTFGSSFSHNLLDINGDTYSDLMVGAYMSNQVVRLYTKPPITMKVDVQTSLVDNIIKDSIHYFSVKACFDYQGDNLPTNVDLDYTISADVDFIAEGKKPRVCILSGTNCNATTATQRETIFLAPASLSCGTVFNVSVVDKNVDLFSPVTFSVVYRIQQTDTTTCTDDVCPVVNFFKPDSDDPFAEAFTKQTVFEKPGCGEDNICSTDLNLQVSNFKYNYGTGDVLTLGKQAGLTFDVMLTNDNEPAYNTRLIFHYHEDISYVQTKQLAPGNVEMNCIPSFEGMTTQLECDTNPPQLGIKRADIIHFQITLDARYLKSTVPSIDLDIQAVSQSRDDNLKNNVFHKTIQVKSEIVMNVESVSNPEFYVTKEAGDMTPLDFYHSVTLLNTGPSSLNVPSILSIRYPVGVIGGQAVVSVQSMILNISSGDMSATVTCSVPANVVPESAGSAYRAFSLVPKNVTKVGDVMNFDCSKDNCEEVDCTLTSIAADSFVSILVNYKVDAGIYSKVKSKSSDSFRSVVLVTDMALSLQNENENIIFEAPSSISVSSEVLPSAPIAEEVKPWIIVVCVLAALLIIAVIVFGLFKGGFFKRKQREELEKQKQEGGQPLVSQKPLADEEECIDTSSNNEHVQKADIEKETLAQVTKEASPLPEKKLSPAVEEKLPIQESGMDESNWSDVDQLLTGLNDYDHVDEKDAADPADVSVVTVPESDETSDAKDIPNKSLDVVEAPEPDYAKIDKSKKSES